jgi:hypothetical protein
MLVSKDGVVYFPEQAVISGKLSGFCYDWRKWMDFRQRKVPEDEAQCLTVSALQGVQDRISSGAMRTLIITIFHKCNGRILRRRECGQAG